MKKTWRVVWVSVLMLAFAVAAWGQGAATPRKKRIAIMDFDYATVHAGVSQIFGQDIDIGKGIADLLVTDLVKDGSYSIIERKTLDKVMAEQNFSNSDRANPASAAKIGKLLGVDAILVGSITQFGNETKNLGVGGGGGNWGGHGLGGFGHKNSKAIVGLSARLVDIDTGEILAVAEGKGESSRSSTSMLGGGGNWHGGGGGDVNFGSSDFQSTIIGEATKLATDQLFDRGSCRQRQASDADHRGAGAGGGGGWRSGGSERRRKGGSEGGRRTERRTGKQGNQRSGDGTSAAALEQSDRRGQGDRRG